MAATLEKKKGLVQTAEKEKNELAIKLLSLKDKSIVHTIKLFVDDLIASSLNKKTTKIQYNKEVEAAVKRVRSGKSISNEEVMREMKEW
jgi:hypothetical protein